MVAFAKKLAVGLGLVHIAVALNTVVDLGYAKYEGRKLNNGVNQYLGMRYAHAPLGDLRFRAPVSPSENKTVQKAAAFGPTCFATTKFTPTNKGISMRASKSQVLDEDCLFVNVWAPTAANSTSKLPVMVFIQGGGYAANSATTYNATQLVEASGHNMVYVSFGYRVGLWGFLAGEKVREDGNLNAGLLDQRFLLQWVQKHISQFGGDPKHVVIQGVSAGAGSVNLHLTNYGARNDGYFVGAIAESTFMPWQPEVSEVEWQYNATVQAAGCGSATDQMKCLRGLARDKLQALNVDRPYPGHTIAPQFGWTPVVDGDMIRGNAYDLFDQGKFIRVPVLYGTCTNEGTDFVANIGNQSDIGPWMTANYPHLSPTDAEGIVKEYPLMEPFPKHQAWYPSLSAAYGEATFICPTHSFLSSIYSAYRRQKQHRRRAAAAAAASAAVVSPSQIWSYRYDVHDESFIAQGLGVPHVFEVPAVFGPTQLPQPNPYQSFETYNAGLVPLLQKYWTSFARELDPNVHKEEGAPEWLPWDGGNRLVFRTNDTKMEKVDTAESGRCAFWKGIKVDMEQ